MNFIEPKASMIDSEYDLGNDHDISLLLFLSMMWEIYIFHSLLILQGEDPESRDQYRAEFFHILYDENSLPVDFCTELLIKHGMKLDVCKFLFIKKEYGRLMYNIQDFYEATGDQKWLEKYVKYIK